MQTLKLAWFLCGDLFGVVFLLTAFNMAAEAGTAIGPAIRTWRAMRNAC